MTTVRLGWIAAGMALVAIHAQLGAVSPAFAYAIPPVDYPIVAFVGFQMLAGGIYLALLWLIPRSRTERGLLVLVLAVGVGMRIAAAVSTPILETDFHRYLWDGAVVAGGDDPYRHSPADVLAARREADGDAALARLAALAEASHPVAQRINHPRLTTIYPPLAQGAFALAAAVEPFSLGAWRAITLLFDAATLGLLFLVLRRLSRTPLWLALYWWNPLVVKELVNSAHMDALLLPALTGSLLLMLIGRRVLACAALALAAGVKLWPVVLLPVALRELARRRRALLAGLSVFLLLFSGTAWWLVGQTGVDAGLGAYARDWRMNDALFLALHGFVANAMSAVGIGWIASGAVTRAILALGVVALALWVCRHAAADAETLCRRFTIVVALVFLLSPAQFPWYYTWLVPFLVVVPSPALLLLSALLPLYYLRFYLDMRGESRLFDHGIVWLEYLPVWLLLLREWWTHARRSPSLGFEARRP